MAVINPTRERVLSDLHSINWNSMAHAFEANKYLKDARETDPLVGFLISAFAKQARSVLSNKRILPGYLPDMGLFRDGGIIRSAGICLGICQCSHCIQERWDRRLIDGPGHFYSQDDFIFGYQFVIESHSYGKEQVHIEHWFNFIDDENEDLLSFFTKVLPKAAPHFKLRM